MDYIELGFHGHGLSSPEYPSMAVKTGRPEKAGVGSLEIKENMVFATNIDIHDPAWRNDVGIMGPGETVLVTKKGPVKLIGAPASLSIV